VSGIFPVLQKYFENRIFGGRINTQRLLEIHRMKPRALAKSSLSRTLLSLFAFCSGGQDVCTACPNYSVEVIALPYCGSPFYGISPLGLSSNGHVTGGYNTCAGTAGGFYWVNGSLTLFNVDDDGNPETFGVGRAINSKLQIVGNRLSEVAHTGFHYEAGKTIDIGMLPGCNYAEAYAINESGQACGYANNVQTGP
jgi:hypothetical protein